MPIALKLKPNKAKEAEVKANFSVVILNNNVVVSVNHII
jgi:hypothetical protein